MAWHDPITWEAKVVTVSNMNQQVRDNLNILKRSIDGNGKPSYDVVAKTSTYAITATDDVILVDCTSGPVAIYLPPAGTTPKKRYDIKKIDASANAVNVISLGGEVDGTPGLFLDVQYRSLTVQASPLGWHIL
ncbi:MAG: hypothetical protein ABI665_03770 [Vicinamibacterales bacterium]